MPRLALALCLLTVPAAQAQSLQLVASRLNAPVYLTAAPGDSSRLFVVEKGGTIRIITRDTVLATPFLDIRDSVTRGSEQGLLGMAFAPDYQTSGRFYVSYTSPHGSMSGGTSVIRRYRVSSDPDRADTTSSDVILTVDQPYSNHNGGMITFGPDGYLYFGLGDGGSGGDPDGTGQNRSDLLGSMLRLDVSGTGAYTIPANNPYAGQRSPRPELWNYGLRNPWRFSFDRATGDLYIGDVGQNEREEIDVQPSGSSGGENYGWNAMEGNECYRSSRCRERGLVKPATDYAHEGGACSVTGGYVYRGAAVPQLTGRYLYADYCAGWVRSFRWQHGTTTDEQRHPELSPGGSITSFGEDGAGELYILTHSGSVYRITGSSR